MMKSELLSGNDICPDKVLKNSGTNEPMIENYYDDDELLNVELGGRVG